MDFKRCLGKPRKPPYLYEMVITILHRGDTANRSNNTDRLDELMFCPVVLILLPNVPINLTE